MTIFPLDLLSFHTWSPVSSIVCLFLICHKTPLPMTLGWYEPETWGRSNRTHNFQEGPSGSVWITPVDGLPFCKDVQSSTIVTKCCNLWKCEPVLTQAQRPINVSNNYRSQTAVFLLFSFVTNPSENWFYHRRNPGYQSFFPHLVGTSSFLRGIQRTQWLEFVSKYCDYGILLEIVKNNYRAPNLWKISLAVSLDHLASLHLQIIECFSTSGWLACRVKRCGDWDNVSSCPMCQ